MAVLGCCFQRIITFNKAQEPNRETKIERNPRGWILGLQIGQTAQGRCNPWEIPEVLCYMLNQELFQNSFGYSVLRCLDGFIISSTFFGPVLHQARTEPSARGSVPPQRTPVLGSRPWMILANPAAWIQSPSIHG